MEHLSNSILGQIQEPFPEEKVARLVDSLLNSTFIQNNQLSQFTVEELGDKLFECKEAYVQNAPQSPPEIGDALELEKCIHDYCLLLQELEAQNLRDFGVQTLHEIKSSQTKTTLVSELLSPSVSESPIESASTLGMNDLGIEPPPLEPAIGWDDTQSAQPVAAQNEPAAAATHWMRDDSDSEEGTSAEEPAHADLSLPNELALDPQPLAPEPGTSESELPRLTAENEGSISKWVELPEPVGTSSPEPVTASNSLFPQETSLPVEKSAQDTLSRGASELWATGEKLVENKLELVPENQRKFTAIAFCMAVEKELHERLFSAVGSAWPERAIPIVTALDTENRRFDLKPSLKAHYEELATNYVQYLYEGKLPFSGVINSLRYILATEELDKFRPSLLDWGVTLFWFGQDIERADVRFTNLLGMRGLNNGQITELAFRLFRMNKYKMKALSVSQTFNEEQLRMITNDGTHALELAKFIHTQVNHDWPKVA